MDGNAQTFLHARTSSLPTKNTHTPTDNQTYQRTGTRSGSWLAVVDTLDPCLTLPAQAFDAVR